MSKSAHLGLFNIDIKEAASSPATATATATAPPATAPTPSSTPTPSPASWAFDSANFINFIDIVGFIEIDFVDFLGCVNLDIAFLQSFSLHVQKAASSPASATATAPAATAPTPSSTSTPTPPWAFDSANFIDFIDSVGFIEIDFVDFLGCANFNIAFLQIFSLHVQKTTEAWPPWPKRGPLRSPTPWALDNVDTTEIELDGINIGCIIAGLSDSKFGIVKLQCNDRSTVAEHKGRNNLCETHLWQGELR
jgi:hypothetical protein